MGTGRRAAVGVVTKGVNVHAPLGIGIVAGNVPADLGGRRLILLLEEDLARDLRVSSNNGDYEIILSAIRRSDIGKIKA